MLKRGFLPAPKSGAVDGRVSAAADIAREAPIPDEAPQTNPQGVARLLPTCLQLLQGATDEKKIAGIVLATRLLPTADDGFRVQVLETLGDTFIDRLLVPLRVYRPLVTSTQPLPAIDDALCAKLERQAASAALGISLLASVVHMNDVVSRPAYMGRWPALAAV